MLQTALLQTHCTLLIWQLVSGAPLAAAACLRCVYYAFKPSSDAASHGAVCPTAFLELCVHLLQCMHIQFVLRSERPSVVGLLLTWRGPTHVHACSLPVLAVTSVHICPPPPICSQLVSSAGQWSRCCARVCAGVQRQHSTTQGP